MGSNGTDSSKEVAIYICSRIEGSARKTDRSSENFPYMTVKVERDCSKLRRSQVKFFSTTERELSGDSVYRLQLRFSSHPTSSSSPRIFQIDVLEHFIFIKTLLCKRITHFVADAGQDTWVAQIMNVFHL